jgi:hypothetical protein
VEGFPWTGRSSPSTWRWRAPPVPRRRLRPRHQPGLGHQPARRRRT